VTPTPTPWTHTETPPPRKPRRLGLYLPYAIAAILAVVWSLVWLWLAGETQRRLDAAAASLRAAGWRAAWERRHVGGYPFRLDVDFTGLSLVDPCGWGVALPALKTEAYAFLPTRWVMFAPAGLSFTRPGAGAVGVAGRALRASVNGWDQHPPRISFEGDDLAFAPAPGAPPFALSRAASVEVYTRAGPDDQGAVLLRVQGGAGAPASWIGRLAQGQSVDLTFDAIFSHAGAMRGRDWRGLITAWSRAGGAFEVRQASLAAGGAGLDARSGRLTVDPGGALAGSLPATVTQPGRVLAALTGAPPPSRDRPAQTLALSFKGDATSLGTAKLGPAVRLY
jgi:hypothetical protein